MTDEEKEELYLKIRKEVAENTSLQGDEAFELAYSIFNGLTQESPIYKLIRNNPE